MFNVEMGFVSLFLESFLYGLYSGLFVLYLHWQYQTSKKDANKTQNIIFYLICSLYVATTAVFFCDIADSLCTSFLGGTTLESTLRIWLVQTASFGCCDFIAQFLLIYRCWIVWGRKTRVVIIPSMLAFAFLGTWLASTGSMRISSNQIEFVNIGWTDNIIVTSLVLSLSVNALVTGLIVFKIFRVFREVRAALDDQILGATGGDKLRRVIFILIESGMALFSIQLARLVVTIAWTDAAKMAYNIIVTAHQIINGITPTIILVRTSMGLSFHDEESMEEFAIESMCFMPNHPNSVPETGSIDIVDHRSEDGDKDGIQRSNDIELVLER